MPNTKYTYSVENDLPAGGVNVDKLEAEIQASAITTAYDHTDQVGDVLDLWFKAALPAGDKTLLDGDVSGPAGGLLAAHDNTPSVSVDKVEVTNQPRSREDGVLYAVPKPSSFGLVMCDRDIRVNTCIVDPAASLEDLKLNTQMNKEEPWNEMTLVGVFKLSAGNMVACADQADANTNGILTIWDFHAKMPNGTSVLYELRDGLLYVDPSLPPSQAWEHRAYAIVAPLIPGAAGGSIQVFDAYMGANPDNLVSALSPQATVLDPTGPYGALVSTLRLYVVHPAGSKLSHVLRLVTYRAPGTF